MSYVIVFEALAGQTTIVEGYPVRSGDYLRSYDGEAHEGRGYAVWTRDPALALRFETGAEAMRFWTQQPVSRPLRPDGRPNRPLTAFTVSILRLT